MKKTHVQKLNDAIKRGTCGEFFIEYAQRLADRLDRNEAKNLIDVDEWRRDKLALATLRRSLASISIQATNALKKEADIQTEPHDENAQK